LIQAVKILAWLDRARQAVWPVFKCGIAGVWFVCHYAAKMPPRDWKSRKTKPKAAALP